MSANYYIVNNSTLRVADIYEAKTASGTPVIAEHKNPSPQTLNQQWHMELKGWELTTGSAVVSFRALEPKFYAVPQGDSIEIGALEATWYVETAIPGFGGQSVFRIGKAPGGPYWTAQADDTQGIKLQPNNYSENQLWTLIQVITPGVPLPGGGP